MSVRQTALILALAATGLSTAYAGDDAGWSSFVGGELGFVDPPVSSTLTREQVLKDLQAFRSNPVAPDGGRHVGGEEGYVFPQHTYARINGEWVCTDKIAHNPRPSLEQTDEERRLYRELYTES